MAILIIIMFISVIAVIVAIISPEIDNNTTSIKSNKKNINTKKDDYFEDYIIFDMINKHRK